MSIISYTLEEKLKAIEVTSHAFQRLAHSDSALAGIRVSQRGLCSGHVDQLRQTAIEDFICLVFY